MNLQPSWLIEYFFINESKNKHKITLLVHAIRLKTAFSAIIVFSQTNTCVLQSHSKSEGSMLLNFYLFLALRFLAHFYMYRIRHL